MMSKKDLKEHEFDYDLQRFMQIREQVQEEIKKIGSHVSTLESTNKRLVAHFDVFEKMSKKAEDQIHAAITAAGFDLARESTRIFSPLIEKLLRDEIIQLNQSVHSAEGVLNRAMEEKEKRPFLYTFLWWSLLVAIGFGVGCLVSHWSTSVLPEELTQKMQLLHQKVDALSKQDGLIKSKKGERAK